MQSQELRLVRKNRTQSFMLKINNRNFTSRRTTQSSKVDPMPCESQTPQQRYLKDFKQELWERPLQGRVLFVSRKLHAAGRQLLGDHGSPGPHL